MPDEFGPEETPSGSPEESVPTGADLDRLLAEAVDLAAEVSAEVGALPSRSEHGNIPIDTLEPDGTDIHERMDELDQILDRTTSEVGLDVPDPMESSAPSGATPAMTVPDFMAEFMEPEPPVRSLPPAPQPGIASPAVLPAAQPSAVTTPALTGPTGSATASKSPSPVPIPDFMAEFTQPEPGRSGVMTADSSALTPPHASRNPPKLGVVGSPVVPMAAQEEIVAPQERFAHTVPVQPIAVAPPQPAMGASGTPPAVPSIPAAASRKSSADVGKQGETSADHSGVMLLPLAVWLVRGLEIVDRPFVRLGQRSRRVIGWLALLLFAASCVVFTASLW